MLNTEVMLNNALILVVEDEALIRINAVEVLESAGFATVEADNADDAMKVLELRGDIRAVFTDINMPGTFNGMRLARLIRSRWPHIHLIVTSGLTTPSAEDLATISKFIPKPYRDEHLIATIRELLQGIDPPILQSGRPKLRSRLNCRSSRW
jgi:CheY-like chemotaxis protein